MAGCSYGIIGTAGRIWSSGYRKNVFLCPLVVSLRDIVDRHLCLKNAILVPVNTGNLCTREKLYQ
jgi:hypothetical protein